MDQFTSLYAKSGCAFILDCRTGAIHPDYHHIPLPPNLSLLVANTGVKHDLVGTPYNDRRDACERAVAAIQKKCEQAPFLLSVLGAVWWLRK
jgi:galactokinase